MLEMYLGFCFENFEVELLGGNFFDVGLHGVICVGVLNSYCFHE